MQNTRIVKRYAIIITHIDQVKLTYQLYLHSQALSKRVNAKTTRLRSIGARFYAYDDAKSFLAIFKMAYHGQKPSYHLKVVYIRDNGNLMHS